MERQQIPTETLRMTLSKGKALLAKVQDFVIAQQAYEYLDQQRTCPACGQRHTSKDSGSTPIKTAFGPVNLANPRWNRCPCQAGGSKTFRRKLDYILRTG